MALDTVSSHKKEPVTFSTVESHWTQVVSSQSSKDIIAYLFVLDNFLARLNVTSSFALDADSEYTTDALCDKITKLLYGPDGELIEPSLLTTEDIANAGLSPERVALFFPINVNIISQVSASIAVGILSNRPKPTTH